MSDNVVYSTVLGKLVNAEVGSVPFLCVFVAGTVPGMGDSHLGFPSDAYPFCRKASGFVTRRRAEGESEDQARQVAVRQWKTIVADVCSGVRPQMAFEFVKGCPASPQFGDSGGSRFLGIFPQPASAKVRASSVFAVRV